jgi:ribosomal protein L44E
MDFGYFLMVKEAVGLDIKYLCKCADYKDPYMYKGSGVYWKRVINKHSDVIIKTTVLGHYKTNEELRTAGIYYSKKYNIVEDASWANLIDEIGDGGSTTRGRIRAYNINNPKEIRCFKAESDIPTGWLRGNLGFKKSQVSIDRTANWHRGRKRSAETRMKMKQSTRKQRLKINCDICGRSITTQNLVRHKKSNKCKG